MKCGENAQNLTQLRDVYLRAAYGCQKALLASTTNDLMTTVAGKGEEGSHIECPKEWGTRVQNVLQKSGGLVIGGERPFFHPRGENLSVSSSLHSKV